MYVKDENTSEMTPTSMRHLLTQLGRSTTPGLLHTEAHDRPTRNETIKLMQKEKTVIVKPQVEVPRETESKKDEDMKGDYRFNNSYLRDAAFNPPLSQLIEGEKGLDCQISYCPREMHNLHGDEVKESAMRELGSIDTLLNRYGYVDPRLRNLTPEDMSQFRTIRTQK